eukprot:scaffold2212_cov143-Cylindrotheca_fusiformis.AAC.19
MEGLGEISRPKDMLRIRVERNREASKEKFHETITGIPLVQELTESSQSGAELRESRIAPCNHHIRRKDVETKFDQLAMRRLEPGPTASKERPVNKVVRGQGPSKTLQHVDT